MKGITNEINMTTESVPSEESKDRDIKESETNQSNSAALRHEHEEEKVIESKNEDSQTIDEAKNESVTEEKVCLLYCFQTFKIQNLIVRKRQSWSKISKMTR